MKLHINGNEGEYAPAAGESSLTIAELISLLGMKSDRVAVELNRDIVPRDRWSETVLHEGDRLEVVHFVGGGSQGSACLNRVSKINTPLLESCLSGD
jgi:thiamine biosynthesis protein ThiS